MDSEEQELRFQKWLEDYRGILVKVTRSFASIPEDFDDLFQEILLQLWKSIPSFSQQCSDSTWIYRVAINRALVWKRKETRRSEIIHVLGKDIADQSIPNRVDAERLELLYEAIRRLTKAERAIVLLALDGLSYREISEIIEISESNVGVRLNRIKKKMTKFMKGDTHGIRRHQRSLGQAAG